MKYLFIILSLQFVADAEAKYQRCLDDSERLSARSQELKQIVNNDQLDRKLPPTNVNGWDNLLKNDLKRRKRVAEIFAEGCFSKAEDYANAALVFQHGEVAEHFFQTFLWANKAVELGMGSQKRLAALGADRYLVNLNKKQLFASQASKKNSANCWCLEPTEKNFSDTLRKAYSGKSYKEALDWVDQLNIANNCPAAIECKRKFSSPNKGSIPGIW